MKTKIASLIATAFVAGIAHAATTWYWTGKGNDANWFTAANWNDTADGTGNAATELASGDSFTFGSVVLTDIEVNYNPPSDNFAVGTVTFDAGVASVTVKGDAVASISAVVNKSSSDQIFGNKVYFSGNIKTIKNGTGSIKYPGGAQGTYIDTSSGWQSDFYGNFRFTHTGEITPSGLRLKTGTFWEWPNATFYRYNGGIVVEAGATGLVANAIIKAQDQTLIGKVDGVFMITNNFSYTTAGTYAKFVDQDGTGDVVVRQVSNDSGRHMVPFLTQSQGRTIIGEGGVGNGDYCRVWDVGNTYHIGSYADWDISYYVDRNASKTAGNAGIYKAGKKASTAVLMFDTTDYYDSSVGRKITSYSIISAQANPQYMRVVVEGIGTFAFANTANPWDLFSGGLIASNTATVAVHAGSRPGAGNVTMTGKTTLAVPESGTATVVGNLTMLPGTKLAFNFTSTETAPVLALGGTLTLPSAGQNPVTVKVSADGGISFRSVGLPEKYQLSTNGKFTGTAVTSGQVVLADDAPFWVRGIGIEDDNLYVYTRAPGLSLSVR